MQRLMPDSGSPDAERRLQHSFIKTWLISALLLAAPLAAHRAFIALTDRDPQPPRIAAVRYKPIDDRGDWGRLALAGRWSIALDDPRFGGLSALVRAGDGLLALSDSGTIFALPFPGRGRVARVRDLPSGPGSAKKKSGRDSEALAADPDGRGWWVAFENRHELRLFDRRFERTLALVSLRGFGWRRNRGVEGLVAGRDGLVALPEQGNDLVTLGASPMLRAMPPVDGHVGDAAALPDGRWLILSRWVGPFGLTAKLVLADESGGNQRTLARLPLGRLGNPEGIAVTPLAGGAVRIWLVTDNDFRRRLPTELVALDWRP